MNEMTVFRSAEFGKVRSFERDGQIWFVASDVCKALEIVNPTHAIKRLDDDERASLKLGRQGLANIVNEFGLYSLVLGSRKPEAKGFKRWITHEVIPAIRKTGRYEAARPSATLELYDTCGPTYAVRVDEDCYEFICGMSAQTGISKARVLTRIVREAMPRVRLQAVRYEMVIGPMED